MLQGIWLVLTVLLPVILSIAVVTFFVGEGEWGGARLKSIFQLSTHKGLVHQGLLWLAVFIPLTVAISLGMWVWAAYTLDLSSDGFKRFIEISIFPLAVMSLSLPLAGLISKFHATQQTAKQIEVISFKNNLDAFYTHRKELLAYFDAMPEINYLGVVDVKYKLHPVLHLRFFKGTPQQGFPQVNNAFFEEVGQNLSAGTKFLKWVLEPSSKTDISALDCYLNACRDIFLAAKALHVTTVVKTLVSRGVMIKSRAVSQEGYDMVTMGTTTLEAIAAIRIVKSYYDGLCDFAGVARWEMPKGHEIVFIGGQKILDGELVIESLHEVEIAALVADKRARYDGSHPLNRNKSI